MSQETFDVVVIGGGPGGYVAAIRAAQLGLKTACVEFRGALGGTCLNVGCIPSKVLLQSSEAFVHAKTTAQDLGVVAEKISFNVAKMLEHKNKTVKQLTSGIEGLFKKNKVTYLRGVGSFVDANTIKVIDGKEETTVKTKNTIIATGSEPIELPMAPFDEKTVVSSTGALDFTEVPKSLVVIGGGVIGLEMGSVWARLGSKVTVIEAMENILYGNDPEVVRLVERVLKKEGMEIHAGTKFKGMAKKGKNLTITCEKGGEEFTIDCEKLLVAVGRRAFTKGLNPEKIGLEIEKNGKVKIDSHFRTNVPNVYAIGDVVAGPMLAHKAEEEGVACAEIIVGKPGHVNYDAIPSVVYTWPEVATVGKTEAQCKAEGIEVRTGKFPFSANGRAKAMGSAEGFVKIVADARTDRILGAQMVGPNASELISEIVLAMEYHASSEDIARTTHAHPTLSEVTKEAALAVDKRALHS